VAKVEIVRVYADPGRTGDEHRVLVDRLWPRGIRKDSLDFDDWAKDAAPSSGLRRWYGHEVGRFDEFARRYRAELHDEPAAAACFAELRRIARRPRSRLVLLTATKDVDHSGAEVLRRALQDKR
jgi:uncharacterized protein YeaO (DUF488 family)